MKPALITALIVTLFAAPLLAQEQDAETRFHEAYLTEVVDGNVPLAARVYIDLMDDPEVPAPLRAESKFRFAVCCVLLGRADEARVRLDEVMAGDGVPAGLRKRAEEYRSSLEGLGVGSELDKRLESLAFELGRQALGPPEGPATYRDFQIIGEPAVPFLKELLGHPDAVLRQHAFRVLCRMDEPGMAAIWDVDRFGDRSVVADLTLYLRKNEGQRASLEEKLLALPDEALSAHVAMLLSVSTFSVEFVEALAGREGCAKWALALKDVIEPTRERSALLKRWVKEGEGEIKAGAAKMITISAAWDKLTEDFAEPEVLRAVIDGLTGEVLGWRQRNRNKGNLRKSNENGVAMMAALMGTGFVLEELERLVAAGESWEAEPHMNPLVTGLVDPLARSLDRRDLNQRELHAYRELMLRYYRLRMNPVYRKVYLKHNSPIFPDDKHFRPHVRSLLRDGSGELLVELMKEKPGKSVSWFLSEWNLTCAGDVRVLVSALSVAQPFAKNLLEKLEVHGRIEEEISAAVVRQAGAFSEVLDDNEMKYFLNVFPDHGATVGGEKAVKALVAMWPRIERSEDRNLSGLVNYALSARTRGRTSDLHFRRKVAVLALAPLFEVASARTKSMIVDDAMGMLSQHDRGQIPLEDGSIPLAEFLREHLEMIKLHHLYLLARYPDLIPVEEWMPLAPPPTWTIANVTQRVGRCDDLVRQAAEKFPEPSDNVIGFVLGAWADTESRRVAYTTWVTKAEGESLARFVKHLRVPGYPLTPETLQATLDRVMEAEEPDLETASLLTEHLAFAKPGKGLFPVVETLLAAESRTVALRGIAIAKRLGRWDLMKGLVPLIDSLDVEVRDTAMEAIREIEERIRVKKEQQERLLEPKPE